jgi:hypothetical protein
LAAASPQEQESARQLAGRFHIPDGVFETGLLGRSSEKKAATLADSNEQDTFSGPV